MPTESLRLPILTPTQNQKEVTVNTAANYIERAVNGVLFLDLSGPERELTDREWLRHGVIHVRSATAPTTLIVPYHGDLEEEDPLYSRNIVVYNGSPYEVTLKYDLEEEHEEAAVGGMRGAYVSALGPNLTSVIIGAAPQPKSVNAFVPGIGSNQIVVAYTVAGDPINIPANFAGSEARLNRPPVGGSVTFLIRRNATLVGSFTFADGENTATFSTAASQTFNAGDGLFVVSPNDTFGIENLSIILYGV